MSTIEEVKAELTSKLEAINTESPPTYDPPHFLSIYRHKCPAFRMISKAILLKEKYVISELDPDYAMTYREGLCIKCRETARSKVPGFVRVSDRPPLEGRVARE